MSSLIALLPTAGSIASSSPSELGAAALLGLLLVWTLIAYQRRRVVRLSSEAAQQICGQGIIVAQACGRVLDANVPAKNLLWPNGPKQRKLRLPETLRKLLADPAEQHHMLRIGHQRLLDISIAAAAKRAGRPRAIVVRDVTEERRGRQHLLQLAHYDSLTGLGNRRLFIDRLESAIAEAETSNERLALLYIDIDRFKEVNDTLGHGVGDKLLKHVAARFAHEMEVVARERQGVDTCVARLSGDEFAIVLMHASGTQQADEVARSVLARIAEPMEIDGRTLSCSGSIGVSLFPDHGGDVEDLVKAADAALYAAKEAGRSRHVLYEDSLRSNAEHAHKIEQELRKAIERGELQLHYQPKVELATDTVGGFEALLRWYNRDLGFVGPNEFIPIAEERGLICELGAWCVEEACRQIRIWQDAGFATVPVSVNVSSVQFRESDLERVISDALVRHELHPSAIEIELTESLILQDDDSTALTLRDLRAIGVRVALDDFGTGYSALTYLNRFPLDSVKMDRGFLRGIEDNDAVAGIASAVISMSHSLGFDVVAEGVDSVRQLELLRSMGCDQIQGFLYSPAIPAEEATRFLAAEGSPRPQVESRIPPPKIDQILSEKTLPEPTEIEASLPAAWAPQAEASEASEAKKRTAPVLVIDEEGAMLGQIALRMVALGADVHLVHGLDEADLFVRQEQPALNLLIVPPLIDLRRFATHLETARKLTLDREPKVLVVGEEPEPERRAQLREAGVDWALWGSASDPELRFFLAAAGFQRRSGQPCRRIRVPIETTGWIRANGQRRVGTVTNLSSRGAFVETTDDYRVGQPIRLEFKIEDAWIRVFANVTFHQEGDDSGGLGEPPGIGTIFYELDRSTEEELERIIDSIWQRHTP